MDSAARTEKLSRAQGTSLHRQIFLVLREQILGGFYMPGEVVPKEEELSGRFGVSRITVRRALADLENLGLIERIQGKGTYVSHALPEGRPAATIGLVDSLRRTANETDVEVLDVALVEPPAGIAAQLNLSPGVRAMHAARLRKSGDTNLMVTEAWIPEHLARGVTAAKLKRRALYEILLDQGIRFGRVVQEITAVAADPRYARLLRAEVGVPLLRVTRLLYDEGGHPVQHLTAHVSPERSRILMDVSISEVNTLSAGHIFHDVTRKRKR